MYAVQKAQANQFTGAFGINNDGSSTCHCIGLTIPIAFQLKDSNGKFITTAQVTFTAQHINPTTGAPIGTQIVGNTPFKYFTSFGGFHCNCYYYFWNTKGLSQGVYVLQFYVDYKKSTQSLLVGPGLNNISAKLTLAPQQRGR
jgi:hypothetical protein